MSRLQTVHIRVNDAATGQPTPCRVRFTDAEEKYYAPYGRPSVLPADLYPFCRRHVPGNRLLGDRSAYIEGTCEIDLPPGAIHAVIEKGIEYLPIDQVVDLKPGKLSLRFSLERALAPQQRGWYSGCVRTTQLSPQEAWLEGAGEGISVINLLAFERETNKEGRTKLVPGIWENYFSPRYLASWRGDFQETWLDYPNLLSFSGQRSALESPDHLVVVNTRNVHPVLGSLTLLNCHRVVYPLRFGPGDYPHSIHSKPDNWTLADWCDQCHRKGGLVIGKGGVQEGETLADSILGKVDAWDWPYEDPLWNTLLALGFRLPLFSAPLGADARMYAQLQENQQLTYGNWIEAVRHGRTFATAGPLLEFQVNRQPPGAEISSQGGTVFLAATSRSLTLFETLEVLFNGAVVLSAPARQEGNFYVANLEIEWLPPTSGWLAARCCQYHLSNGAKQFLPLLAQTSPHYVAVPGRPQTVDPNGVRKILETLDSTLYWVNHEAKCETPDQRERLAKIFVTAKEKLESMIPQ
jgi:hypothetical protein